MRILIIILLLIFYINIIKCDENEDYNNELVSDQKEIFNDGEFIEKINNLVDNSLKQYYESAINVIEKYNSDYNNFKDDLSNDINKNLIKLEDIQLKQYDTFNELNSITIDKLEKSINDVLSNHLLSIDQFNGNIVNQIKAFDDSIIEISNNQNKNQVDFVGKHNNRLDTLEINLRELYKSNIKEINEKNDVRFVKFFDSIKGLIDKQDNKLTKFEDLLKLNQNNNLKELFEVSDGKLLKFEENTLDLIDKQVKKLNELEDFISKNFKNLLLLVNVQLVALVSLFSFYIGVNSKSIVDSVLFLVSKLLNK